MKNLLNGGKSLQVFWLWQRKCPHLRGVLKNNENEDYIMKFLMFLK